MRIPGRFWPSIRSGLRRRVERRGRAPQKTEVLHERPGMRAGRERRPRSQKGSHVTGKICKGIAGFYYVHGSDGAVYECRAKGIFRNKNIKPLVGDNVRFAVLSQDPPQGSIEQILPRTGALVRPAAANVDQALVVFAMADPEPNLNLVDRCLVLMERSHIPAILLFNKADLAGDEEKEGYRRIYEAADYPVMFGCVRDGAGMERVRECLAGKTTILAGPSGVGKSSLTNLLIPDAGMQTGAVSEKIRRGKHTTRHSELFCMNPGTYLMDTPGFGSVFVDEMEPEELKACFPEFEPFEGECRFPGCVHVGERVCNVKAAADAGRISMSRYKNYRLFYEELKGKRRY